MIIYPIFKNVLVQHKNKIIWLVFIIIGIATLPNPVRGFGPGLDQSGLIALSWIAFKNLQIGSDIIWIFGPYGYFYTTTFVYPSLWFPPLLYHIFVHSFFIFSIGLLTTKLSIKWKDNLFVFLLMPTLVYVTSYRVFQDDHLVLSFVIIFYILITNRINRKYELPILFFVATLLAFESMIKLNMAIANLSTIIIFCSISIFMKERKRAIILFFSYMTLVPMFWILSGQELTNLLPYANNVLGASTGYSYGMATEGPLYQVIAGIIGAVFVIILLIYSVLKNHKNLTIFILLNGILLFMSIKHGFVRHDLHVMNYFFTFGVFFVSTYLIFKYDSRYIDKDKIWKIFLLLLFVGSILYVVNMDILWPPLILPDITKTIPAYGEVFPLVFDESYQNQKTEGFKSNLKNYHRLDKETIDIIGNKTVDIIPWDVSVPWSYDFNWSPRPMLQSFMSYPTFVDNLNAQHFSDKKDAPQQILYAYKSIDFRYPLFDEPKTFSTILQNYNYTRTSGEFLILSHSSEKRFLEIKEDLGVIESEFGKPIKIPKFNSGYVFVEIDLKFNAFGKFINIMYKPAPAHIMFKFSDQTYSEKFRFLPGSSNNGVFVSQYVESIYDLKSIFSGELSPNIDEIIIFVDNPNHYEESVKIKFVGVPAQLSINDDVEIKMPDWNLLKPVQGGMMSIDWIGSKLFSQEGYEINFSNNVEQLIPISGWAVDDILKESTGDAFIVLHNEGKETVLATKKQPRPDLNHVFDVNSYEYAGWKGTINTKDFEEQCYALTLRIIRSNGQEYFELDSGKLICFNS